MRNEIWQTRMEIIFIYFIIAQPILDVLAYFGFPISEVVRMGAIAAGVGYLWIKKAKGFIFYLCLLSLFFCFHFIINLYLKDPYAIVQEATYIIKTFYFIVIFFTYLFVAKAKTFEKKVIQNIVISMALITIVMLIAELTNTGKSSYDMLAKAGHTGWFYSGNELSAIMAIGLGYIVILLLKTRKQAVKIILFLLLITSSWSIMTVGTKVSYGALIIVLSASLFWLLFNSWKNRTYHPSIHWLAIAILFMMVLTPYSAIGKNLNVAPYGKIATEESQEDVRNGETSEVPVRVLNGRDAFLSSTIQQFQDAPTLQQFFGMGRGGNYVAQSKFIEMDFFDWFFSFGLIGFILLVFPFVYAAFLIIKTLRWKHFANISLYLTSIAVCLGLGAAFFAGHVLSSPAVSIYLAISLAYLIQMLRRETTP